MSQTPDTEFELLSDLLSRQCRAYAELAELSGRQGDMISDDSEAAADALLALLGQRRRIVQRIAHLNQELAPFRRDWQTTFDSLNPAQQRSVSSLVRRLNELLGDIVSRDREDYARLETRRQIIRDEIDRISGGQRAHAGYGASSSSSSIGSSDLTG